MDVLGWLLDSDPAIRWQALRDLADATGDVVSAERARVAHDGWGAQLLALQGEDGQWAGGACFPAGTFADAPDTAGDASDAADDTGEGPGASDAASAGDASDDTNRAPGAAAPGTGAEVEVEVEPESPESDDDAEQPWTATLPTLEVLHALGVDPRDPVVRTAIDRVREGCRWEHAGQAFFAGEVEACINGRTALLGSYFGEDVDGIVARLVGEQLDDGGWNCWALYGARRSSFHSTICVLEGLLGHEQATGGTDAAHAARVRGEEYLLSRGLFRRASTGEVIKPKWLQFSFPTYWHYDVLRALEHFRRVGGDPDPRLEESVEVVRSKRQPDGTWLLENTHPGAVHLALDAGDGAPSRWNTLRALRVLRWADGSARGSS